METFIGIFIYCFPVKKIRKLNISDFLQLVLQLIWFEIFYNEESSILCTIHPALVVFRGVFELQYWNAFLDYFSKYLVLSRIIYMRTSQCN